jgi:uncharacterized membrane protein
LRYGTLDTFSATFCAASKGRKFALVHRSICVSILYSGQRHHGQASPKGLVKDFLTNLREDTVDHSPDNAQIEQYLDRLCVWLALLPETEREEIRQEFRLHIAGLVASEAQEGKTQTEAVAAALDKMGDADTLGERLYQARIKQALRQIGKSVSPSLKVCLRRFLFMTVAWGGVIGLAMALPIFHMQLMTWTFMLTVGTVIGIGFGIIFGWYYSQLPANPTVLASLPEGASLRGRQFYRQQQGYIRRFGLNSQSRLNVMFRTQIPFHIIMPVGMAVMTQLAVFPMRHHFVLAFMRSPAQLAVMFAVQDITTLIVCRVLKRKPAQQP